MVDRRSSWRTSRRSGAIAAVAGVALVGIADARQSAGVPNIPAHPNGELAPSGKFRVFGYDISVNDDSPTPMTAIIPTELVDRMEKAWSVHERFLGAPRIDTTLNGKPVIFVRKRPAWTPDAAATVENWNWNSTVATTGNYKPADAGRPICATPGAVGWCLGDKFSLHYNLDHWRNPFGAAFTSHEFVHAYHNRVLRPNTGRLPHWVSEAAGNGWGNAFLEHADRAFTRRSLARRYATAPSDSAGSERMFSFVLGLRHYDQPLAIDHVQDTPWRHPDYPPANGSGKAVIDTSSTTAFIEGAKGTPHIRHTGYLTGSFFRQMLKGRPGGAIAIRAMHDPAMRPPTDARDMRDVLRWLDRGLKSGFVRDAAGGGMRPVWRRGLRDVFSEMIVELADFPDLVAGSRAGQMAQPAFDRRLWARGCHNVDLSANVAATVQLKIPPIAARCLRVKFADEAAPPNWVALRNSPYAGPPVPYLPENFSITVEDAANRDTCGDIDVGTRGELLSLGAARPLAQGGCAVSWSTPYAPLEPTRAGGLKGYQTVVVTNVADKAEETSERTVTVRLVRPSVSATVSGTATPTNRGGGAPRPKKPLPKPKRPQQPAPPTPGGVTVYEPVAPNPGCDAETRALFQCGDEFGFGLTVGDSAEAARAIAASLAATGQIYLPAEITRGSGVDGTAETADTVHRIFDASGQTVSTAVAALMAPGNGSASGMKITVSMQPLQPGQTGTFPAHVEVDWHSGNDAGIVNSVEAAATRSANGCVQVVSRKTGAQVRITQNTAGFMLGSLSARLFEDEEDAESACRQPIRLVGTIEIAFASPGVARSDLEPVSFERAEIRGEIDRDIIAQQLLPIDERSDFDADELAWASARAPAAPAVSGGAVTGAMTCQIQLTDRDRQAFAEAVAAGHDVDGAPPEVVRQMIDQTRTLIDGPLRPHLCAWATAGRPRVYSITEKDE